MKKVFLILILISVIVFGWFQSEPPTHSNLKILISQTIEHPALNATVQGIIDELNAQNFNNLVLRTESAQANSALAAQIAGKFVAQKPDLVVGVGTLSAQSFLKYVHAGSVKLIFSSITDPESAQLIGPNVSCTGVSNFVPLDPQIQLFLKLQPQLKKLGIIYQTGEINSISLITKLEILCKKLNIILIKQSITKTGDVPQAATKLAQESDAIFISNDNTALSGLASIIQAANLAKIPVYVSDTDAVALGALAALGPNQYQLGRQTGKIISQILQNKNIKNIPVQYPEKTELFLNLKAAKLLNIPISNTLLKQADRIIN